MRYEIRDKSYDIGNIRYSVMQSDRNTFYGNASSQNIKFIDMARSATTPKKKI